MSNGFEQLVTVLQSRYDFQSARTMAREALSAAGLKEQPSYSKDELQQFVDGLSGVGTNLDRIWTALGVAPSGAPAPAPAEAKPAAAKADDKKEAKADDKKDAKADDKKDAKADDKKDAKADDKKDAKADDKADDKKDAKADDKGDDGDGDDKKGKKK